MWKRNNNFDMENIDVTFDFTSDTPNYWDGFWNNELGYSKRDPDSKSPMLRKYHQILWSRELPCGEKMELTDGKSHGYLSLLTLTPERLQKPKVRRAKRRRCRRRSIPLKKEKPSSCVGRKTKAYRKG